MRPTAPSTNHIILAMLESGHEVIRSRALASLAGVSQRAASDVIRFLEFHGGVTSHRQVRWQATAKIAGMLRLATMHPARTIHTSTDALAAARALEAKGIAAAVACTTAANQWAFFEPHRDAQLFIERGTTMRAEAAIADARSSHGGTHTITLFEADMKFLGTARLGGIGITSRLQTWLDLKHFPRAGAHEAFFRRVIEGEYPQAIEA